MQEKTNTTWKKKDNMKVVILAGGKGTRISEESQYRPKPMVEIGGRPILWHIMNIYSSYGFNDFVICAGYKQEIIKEYFLNYYLYNDDLYKNDVVLDFSNTSKSFKLNDNVEPWKITIVDTGLETMTGGRIKRIKKYIGNEPFLLTYGDGVSDIDIKELIKYHNKNNKIVTLTAVTIPQRYGVLDLDENNIVKSFREKDNLDGSLINAGFMVCEPKIFDYIKDDLTVFEKEPLEKASKNNEIIAYKHDGFWQSMDSLREKKILEELWNSGKAPWKVWK